MGAISYIASYSLTVSYWVIMTLTSSQILAPRSVPVVIISSFSWKCRRRNELVCLALLTAVHSMLEVAAFSIVILYKHLESVHVYTGFSEGRRLAGGFSLLFARGYPKYYDVLFSHPIAVDSVSVCTLAWVCVNGCINTYSFTWSYSWPFENPSRKKSWKYWEKPRKIGVWIICNWILSRSHVFNFPAEIMYAVSW